MTLSKKSKLPYGVTRASKPTRPRKIDIIECIMSTQHFTAEYRMAMIKMVNKIQDNRGKM